MKPHIIRRTIIASAVSSCFLVATPAHASGAAAVVAAVQMLGQQMVSAVVDSFAKGFLSPLITKGTAQVQGEIAKGTQAQIQADMAIAQFHTTNRMQEQAVEILEKSQPAYGTCNAISGAEVLKSSTVMASQKSGQEIAFMGKVLSNYTGDASRAKQLHAVSTKKYATADDVRRDSRLRVSENLPGADVDASYLFGAKNGDPTYVAGQDEAVTLMIDRMTTHGAPTALANPKDEDTQAGMMYREAQKRYASMVSIAQDALVSIKNNHAPVNGGKSVFGTLSELINTRFSKENIVANATTSQPVVILRDIAIMTSAQMTMDYMSLKNQEKMIAMLATQQVMLANETAAQTAETYRLEVQRNATR